MPTRCLFGRNASTLLVLLGVLLSLNNTGTTAADFYVSASGRDDWSGRHAAPDGNGGGPLATLQRARDAVREFKASTGLPEGGVTIWIAPGTYSLDKGLVLTIKDSGEPAKPIVYRATAEGKVQITGGKTVAGWRAVDDTAILGRLVPAARGNVLQADLIAQGISDFGKLRSRGFARSTVPAGLELFFRGQPMTLSRWPNTGFLKITGSPERTGDEHGGTLGELAAGFHYDGDRPTRQRRRAPQHLHQQ